MSRRSSHGASLAGAWNGSLINRQRGIDESGLPVPDMITASEVMRCGWLPASTWAIMPPIDAPTTCALVDLEVVQQLCDIVGEVDQRVRHRAAPAEQVAPDASVHRALRR